MPRFTVHDKPRATDPTVVVLLASDGAGWRLASDGAGWRRMVSGATYDMTGGDGAHNTWRPKGCQESTF